MIGWLLNVGVVRFSCVCVSNCVGMCGVVVFRISLVGGVLV